MTLENRVRDLAIRIATEINTNSGLAGDLASLATTDKTTLVAAINEVLTVAGSAAVINDTVPSLTTTYSGTKIDAEISQAVADLVDSAPGLLDTLGELATALQGNDADIAGILTAQSLRVRVDTAAQGLSAAQMGNARTNIDAVGAGDIGDFDRDFVADFEGALT